MLSKSEKLELLRSRLSRPDASVLSEAQARLWELEQQLASRAMHVFALAYYLDGPLDVDLLADAIASVARRHPALRSRIAVDEGRPVFHVAAAPVLERRSLTGLGDTDVDAALESALRAEAETPIDPGAGAGWRCVLFERAADSHALLAQFHHIFADRWSVGVFMSDLSVAYRNLLAGCPAFDAELSHAEPLPPENPDAQLSYWTSRFAAPATTLELPGAHRMEVFSSYEGSRIESRIAPEIVAVTKALAADESTTLFPLLLAAFAATLNAHTGQDDLVICTPMVGRHRAGTRGAIGYFNNIVPLRLDLSGDPTFRELVARITTEGRESSAHQDVPFHSIAGLPELGATRITRCLFAGQNIPGLHLDLPGVTVRYRDVPNGTANFDLALFLEEIDGRLDLLLDHKTAVLDGAAAESLRERFLEILRMVTVKPGLRLSELPQYDRPEKVTQAAAGGYRPRNLLEHRMVEIWKSVFRGAAINGNSHFFELGGDSMRAAQLFHRIEKEFGHQLPLSSLFEAPTPRQLTRKMRDTDWVAPWLSLIPLKTTGNRPPLFCVHGGGGNVLTFRFLADSLDEDQPLYCLQAKGLKSGEKPLSTVEEMASHYLESVRQLRPHGPYLLMGHSVGAAIAYEMAQRLEKDGDHVAFLGMLDHPGPTIHLNRLDWVRFHLMNLSMLRWHDRVSYVWRSLMWRTLTRRVARRLKSSPERQIEPVGKSNWRVDTLEQSMRALSDYKIMPYPGRLTLFRALQGTPRILADPLGGWGGVVAGGVETHDVPGTHNGMLEPPNAKTLGLAISHCLN